MECCRHPGKSISVAKEGRGRNDAREESEKASTPDKRILPTRVLESMDRKESKYFSVSDSWL